jgi:5-enolpyruvylshikimate-3-phosphate synthase
LDELRSAFDQKWRNCLNKAEKNELEMIFSDDEDLFDEVSKVYVQMAIRKGLTELNNINHLKKVQKDLPESKN